MAVTMKQIAARCGLSLPTVSYVLNGKDELFRPATKERVWAAARELGYRPNSAALAMRSGKFSSVGLVIGIQEKSTYMPFAGVEGIHDALAEVDYHLVVSRLSLKVLEVGAELPKLLRQWMVDGLIYNFTENAKGIPERLEALVDEYKIPAVWLNDKRPQNAVYPDDEGGGKRAAQYLLELGHRKIAYVGPASEDAHYSQRDRMNGVMETIKAGGGTVTHCNLRWNENRREDAKALLSGADKPTAVGDLWKRRGVCALSRRAGTGPESTAGSFHSALCQCTE